MSGGKAAREPALPTIVIVDDAPEVRLLVRTRLRLSRKLRVLGEAANGAEAVEAARQHHPDLMLLDVSMPVMDGLESLPRVLEVSPETRVVMYSGFQEQGLAQRAVELGAAVFLEKSSSLATLADDLITALGGSGAPVATELGPEETDDDADASVLREHLERFREVFDDAAIGMATVTLAGQIVRANAALAELLGRSVDALVGTPYAEFAGASADRLAAVLQEILDGTSRVVHVEHAVTVDHVERQVRATLAPVLDSIGRPLYLFLQVQDVTAQRAAEEQLRQSEARFRLIVEAVEDYAIFMLSPEGLVQSWNAGAQRIKGYTEDEIVGRHFRTFYPPDVAASGHPERELEMALRDGHYEEEGWRLRKDGTRFWANVLITAVHDRDGRHVGFAKVTRDNSERREMLAQLQQAADDQAHFLAVTAHELRTPVGVLAGTAETLREHWSQLDDTDRDDLLDGMASSAARLRRLLTDLLTASRLQASALELSVERVDVLALAETAVATAKRINPDVDVSVGGDPGLVVEGDADRLAQVLDNLVGNALRHGTPPVHVSVHRAGESGRFVRIVVSDAGGGVPEEMRERLFDRFATGRARGGTGLGLFIVRQLARSHGGDASYEPPLPGEPGSGGFVVSLPLAGRTE